MKPRWAARFSATDQIGSESHPVSCTEGTGSLWVPPSLMYRGYRVSLGPTQPHVQRVPGLFGSHPASCTEGIGSLWVPPSLTYRGYQVSLGPTQPHVQRVPGLFPGGKAVGAWRWQTILRDMYRRPCKRAALFIRTLLGNLKGVRLLGLLRDRENAYLGSFLGPRGHWKLRMGAIWNFSKEQGSTELISDYGARRACL
jgi:hypothetical protein